MSRKIVTVFLLIFCFSFIWGETSQFDENSNQNKEITLVEGQNAETLNVENIQQQEKNNDNESSKNSDRLWKVIGGIFCIFCTIVSFVSLGSSGASGEEEMYMGFGALILFVLGVVLLVSAGMSWTFIYSLKFLGAGAIFLAVFACIFTPLCIWNWREIRNITACVIISGLDIIGCILIYKKMGSRWWLWKYVLVSIVLVGISWCFNVLFPVFDILLERVTDKIEEHKNVKNQRIEKQQKELQRQLVILEQKKSEEMRNLESAKTDLERKTRTLSDNIVLFQNSIDKKEPVNLQLLKMIEDSIAAIRYSIANLDENIIDEIKRNKKYLKTAFADCKNLEGYSNSSRSRMETIIDLFDSVIKRK